jgi:hypothetical protein
MSEGVETENVIIKHVEDTDTFYADFEPALGTGETLSSVVSATPTDSALTLSSAAVLTVATTDTKITRDAAGNTTTVTYVIAANKGISFVLAGGTTGTGLSKITAKCLKSTGKTVTRDILVAIKGVDVT